MEYILLLGLIVILSIIGIVSKNTLFFKLIMLIVILFSGLRFEVGRDFKQYQLIYDNIVTSVAPYSVNEPGYILLVKLVHFIGGTQQLIFLMFSAITMTLYSKFIIKNSPLIYVSLLIFICVGPFFLSSLNQVRQYAAIGMFLFALKYVKDKKLFKYLLVIFTSTIFFHLSTILVIPFYFLLNRKLTLFQKGMLLVLVLISIKFLFWILSFTPYNYFIVRGLESDYDSALILFQLLIALGVFIFSLKLENDENRMFFNMNLVSIMILLPVMLLNNISSELFLRLNNYFFAYMIICIPLIVNQIKVKELKILLIMCVLIGIFLYYFRNTIILGVNSNILPYKMNFELF